MCKSILRIDGTTMRLIFENKNKLIKMQDFFKNVFFCLILLAEVSLLPLQVAAKEHHVYADILEARLIPMEEALKKLEKKYQVSIAYLNDVLGNKLTNVKKIDGAQSIEEALTLLLEKEHLNFRKKNENFFIIYAEKTYQKNPMETLAQERVISGKVTDEQDQPLPGVSVLALNTTSRTSTNADGFYSLKVPPNTNSLRFSYIGFNTTDLEIEKQSIINIKLTPNLQSLDEVVVTAAGIERKVNTLGYSVSTVTSELLAQKNEPDPVRALAGKVAGVNVQGGGGVAGGSTNITIRGNSSLGNNNQPLYVVDGVPFDNSTFSPVDNDRQTQGAQSTGNRSYDIDPNNIQSMTVLKGAAAAALYGSRAANGAIIITTKSASQRSRKGTEISFNTSYSLEKIAGLPDYQNKYGQGTNGDYRNGVYGSYGSAYSTRETIPHPLARSTFPASRFPEFYEADGKTPLQVPYRSYAGKSQRDFFRNGYVLENALNINSGTEKGSFTIGLSNSNNNGIVSTNSIERTSISVGGNARLDNGFYTRGSINYVKTGQKTPPIGGSGSIMTTLYYLPTSYNLTDYPYEDPVTGANVYDRANIDNPYWSIKHSPSTSDVDRYFGNFVLGIDITPWLNIQNTAGFNAYTDRRVNVLGKGSGEYAPGAINTDQIYRQELDNTFLATFTKTFKDIDIKAILGNNINQRLTKRSAFSGDAIIVDGINDIRNTTTITLAPLPNNQAEIKQRYYAFFADLTFDYKGFASLNLVGRNDISSTLPKENRSYLYGGINGSLIFSEAFNLPKNILSFGSLRAGYTQVGNEASPYQTITVFNANTSFGDLGSPFSNGKNANVSTQTLSNTLANGLLKPEFITEFEIGTELRFLQDRISLDFTYYNKRSSSQIFVVNAAPSSGYTQRIINLGETSNKGIEVLLSATPVRSNTGISWEVSTNFTRNRNMVENIGSYAQLTYGGNVHIAGQPYGLIYGSRYARDDEGNILVNPVTAKPIVSSTEGAIGNPNPDFIWALNNSFTYKGLTFGFLFDWKQGGQIYSSNIGEALARGVTRDTEDRERLLIGPGVLGDVNTFQPILDANGNKIPNNTALPVNDYYFSSGFGPSGPSAGVIDEASVFDATVFRLREISFGYSIPKKILERTPFGSVYLSFSARNLWYKAPNTPKYMNYDPEVSTASANNMGYDSLGVPTTKRFGFNLRVTF